MLTSSRNKYCREFKLRATYLSSSIKFHYNVAWRASCDDIPIHAFQEKSEITDCSAFTICTKLITLGFYEFGFGRILGFPICRFVNISQRNSEKH